MIRAAPHAHPAPATQQSTRGAFANLRLAVYAGACLAAVAFSRAGRLRGARVMPVAVGAVAIAMWHGAYDAVQARPLLEPKFGPRWPAVFGGAYLLLTGATFVGWSFFPLPSLLLFLAYSSWHFGAEPEQTTPSPATAVTATAYGAIPILAACYWQPAAVEPIVSAMLGRAAMPGHARAEDRPPSAQALVRVLGAACPPVLLLALLGISVHAFGRSQAVRLQSLTIALLTAMLFAFCHPMTAFAVYFCLWHTPEHLIATSNPAITNADANASLAAGLGTNLHSNLRANLRAGFVPWLASLLFLAAVWRYGRRAAASYQAGLFIVLSALTAPHMALSELHRLAASADPARPLSEGLAA